MPWVRCAFCNVFTLSWGLQMKLTTLIMIIFSWCLFACSIIQASVIKLADDLGKCKHPNAIHGVPTCLPNYVTHALANEEHKQTPQKITNLFAAKMMLQKQLPTSHLFTHHSSLPSKI